MSNTIARIGTCAVLALALAAGTATADNVRSLESLNEYLQPEPYVNLGSDGVLSQLPTQTPQLVTAGKSLYARYCAACHGKQLEGQGNWNTPTASGVLPAPPHDKTGHTWHHADDQLFEYVKYGPAIALNNPDHVSAMPAFGGALSDDEILAILVFIRSSWPEKERKLQAATNDDQSGR